MRCGFTTGSCAAAASKAAAYMLLTGREKRKIEIDTPKGIVYRAEIKSIERTENQVSCAVEKDGGDDPDITTGTLIFATVSIEKEEKKEVEIIIDGGYGVGRVTKPGLDQSVGNAAINRVPREMIEKEVRSVCDLADFKGVLSVIISVPQGEILAKRTLNPRLGIEGGISILGTTGIVEPMSSLALLETIRAELSVKRAEGIKVVAVSPGNYGMEFMKRTYEFDLDKSVKCSNFIGDTIDMMVELGFSEMLLTGHIGKLVKLSGGIMNTHSKEGDCRMELLSSAGILSGIKIEIAREILNCVTTEEAVKMLNKAGYLNETMNCLMDRILFHLKKRANEKLRIECILYTNELGELIKSKGAKALLMKIKEEESQKEA